MADVFTTSTRSSIMQRVRGKENKSTELRLIKFFRDNGITGWRRSYPVKGHPDFVFLDKKIAIFVDGCFWHGHNCRNVTPKNNAEYWNNKIENNKERDKIVTSSIQKKGWQVIRIWECELKLKEPSGKLISLFRELQNK